MFNEDVDYTEDDINGNGDSVLEYEEEEEYLKIRKEHVFSEIDFTKRKTKIVCTLGYSISFVDSLDHRHQKWKTL
jgi:hypothetical protein